MKNKLIALTLVLFLIIGVFGTSYVFAYTAAAVVNISVSSSIVKPGDEVTVTITTAAINEGIAGMNFLFNYDDTVFDYVSELAGNGWTVTKVENSYTLFTTSYEATTTTGTLLTIKLKAKSTITTDTSSDVSISAVSVTKDDASTADISGDTTGVNVKTVKLSTIEVATQPTNKTYTEGDNFNAAGMVVKANYTDGTSKTITNYTIINGTSLKANQTSITITYTEGGVTKEATQPITVKKAEDNGTNDGTNNGTSNGTNDGTNNGTSNGTNNGTSNGTNNGTSNGTSNGTNNGTSNGTNNGTSNGTNNGTNNGTSSSTEKSTTTDGKDETSTDGKIPQTGDENIALIAGVVFLSTMIIVSFIGHRKIKIK